MTSPVQTVPRVRVWEGTPYTQHSVASYCGAVEQTFERSWLEQPGATDPLRQAWQRTDPHSTIALCRVGRDILALHERHDPQQVRRLEGLVRSQIKPNPAQAADFLYELHTATLFDPSNGVVGTLAPPGVPGYDLTIELPGQRHLWVSCKRLQLSQSEGDFKALAARLSQWMREQAAACGHAQFDALVATANPLTHHDPALILHAWDDLCGQFTGEPREVLQNAPPVFLRVQPSVFAAALGSDYGPGTLDAAVRIQFLSPMPPPEHRRILTTFKEAAKKLQRTVPVPSRHDLRLVALEVPEFVSIRLVVEALDKRFSAGHDRDIAAVLLTRALPTSTVSVPPRHTVAEEFYLLVNVAASVALPDFLGKDHLVLRVEGHYMPQQPRLVVVSDGREVDLPDGYMHTEYHLSFRFSAEGTAALILPPVLPPVLLAPEDLAQPDSELAITAI